jgi:hypothetical protein
MYGTTGRRYVDTLRRLARQYQARHILDYGCGKRDVWSALHDEFDVRNFDPAIPGLDARPEPADLVTCIDVLEHVEMEFLDNVLADLAHLTLKVGFLTIATRPSGKTLSDGANCHRILKGADWWTQRIRDHFHLPKSHIADVKGVEVVVKPKSRTNPNR